MFTAMRTRMLSLLLLVALLAACGGGGDDEGNGGGGTQAVEEEPVLCPLTGVEAPAGVDVNRPALAVKIDNAPPARPQAGVEAADVVYEELGEGGLTRFLTIFHCNDAGSVGPVRSARNVDPEILKEYEPALFAYSGANTQVLAKISDASWIVDLKHGDHGDAYTRASDRRAPYNLMTTTAAIRGLEGADAGGPPESALEFNAEVLNPPAPESPSPGATASPAAPAAAPGNSVSLSYSNANVVRYNYDPATKAYLRFNGDTPHQLANGNQLSAVNVVVQKVRTAPGTVRDASGTLTVDTIVVGSGEATVLRGGTAVTGTWSRASLDDQTTFTDASGQPIEFAPGSVFIHLVPQERAVTVQ
jgi:hypothetical protein